jgi:hypothetical protein
LLPLIGALLAGCHVFGLVEAPYIVTATPFDLIGTGHPGFCVAVDPKDAHGVWWWEPGRSGCSSRSTGPEVFRASRATVAKASGAIEAQFEVALKNRPPLQVKLTIDDDGMRREPSGERVSIERRRDLDVPEWCCPQSSM